MNPRLGPAMMTAGGTALLPTGIAYLLVVTDPFARGVMAVLFALGGVTLAVGYVLREVANTPRL